MACQKILQEKDSLRVSLKLQEHMNRNGQKCGQKQSENIWKDSETIFFSCLLSQVNLERGILSMNPYKDH